MKPPIGISDFRKLIVHQDPQGKPYLFADKSLFIKEIIDDPSEVILITRPRRFGKTLNLSMLHHFFAKEVDSQVTHELFEHLKISHYPKYMKYQGQSPVIYLTFKDIKSANFNSAYAAFYEVIRSAYLVHEKEILFSSKITDREKKDFEQILDRKASNIEMKVALKQLTLYLNRAHGVKPIILIDEYDTPIQTAYMAHYYQEMVIFMREFLGAGLKDNTYLNKAVLTGILRVSKESLFSGLNNINTYSLLDSRYGEHFGFTEEEIDQLLKQSKLEDHIQEVRTWYNGYQVGTTVLYNPWSVVKYIYGQGDLRPHWVNTSDNALIKELLIQSSTNFKVQIESLLKDEPIKMLITEHITFNDLPTHESAIWTLLLMSGYLKPTVIEETGQGSLCQLKFPNKEVKDLYRTLIAEWLSGVNNATVFNIFINNLLEGNLVDFEDHLKKMALEIFSVHDVKGKTPEKFYHGFMLGLLSSVDKNQYNITSNRESGLGRYDIMVIPQDSKKLSLIFEIKSIDKNTPEALKKSAEAAIKQIDNQHYAMVLHQHKIQNCLKIGIAFCGKELAIIHQMEELI